MRHTDLNELQALKEGSEKAFEAIYQRYAGKLYHFMMKLSKGDSYIAEEMVQTAFIKLWEVRDQIHPEESILSYLSAIAKNNLMNRYKRQTVEFIYQKMLEQQLKEQKYSPEEEIEGEWLGKYFDELTNKLPPVRKKIFLMSRKEQLLNREIAERLGLSVSTVETHISLALKYLRRETEKSREKLFVLLFALVNIL